MSAAEAMAKAMQDSQHRQDYHRAHPEGVPAGTTGADVRPLDLPTDTALTGVSDHPLPGGEAA